jgi:hypothetical protein
MVHRKAIPFNTCGTMTNLGLKEEKKQRIDEDTIM